MLQKIQILYFHDYWRISFRFQQVSYGIVLLRFSGISNPEKAAITLNVLTEYGQELCNKFTVVGKDTVRIRDL